MAAVIVRKKDLENLGKELMKEVYSFLHDEYILTFEEMKVEQDKLKKNLVKFYFESLNFTKTKTKYSWGIEHEEFDESKYEETLKEIEGKIEKDSLDIKVIYQVLNNLKLDFEIDEDLFFKKEAFISIYKVYKCDYRYL